MIPPHFVQDLLTRTDIVDVVGQHVELKKAGINHKGLCPFHNEKSPSFIVNATRQTFHCFGCGVHGDAIEFLMQHCAIAFTDAVSDLAQRAGLSVPHDEHDAQAHEKAQLLKKQKATLSDLLAQASRHYQQQIGKHTKASAYLIKRGLSPEITERFGLGYAPEGWRFLSTVLPDYSDPRLIESGMVITPAQGHVEGEVEGFEANRKRYDRFRDRLMFPIRSVQGDVIGFGGRVIDAGEPKYLNSPETPVFSKGRELYGLHEARKDIRHKGFALVVEGYMDVVALAQAGWANAVATLGTACTAEHIIKLFRFTDNIVFSFDGDRAGRRAAGRALEAVLPMATDARSVRFLFLPPEHDPDSYVREKGPQAFNQSIDQATPLSKHLIDVAQTDCDVSCAEGRAKFLVHAKPLWHALTDGALKRQLLTELARHGGLPIHDLTALWQLDGPSGAEPQRLPAKKTKLPATQPPRPAPSRRRDTHPTPSSPEDHVLRMLLLHSEWLEQLPTNDHDLISHLPPPHGEIGAWLERQVAEHGAMPWAALEPALRAFTGNETINKLIPQAGVDDEFDFSDLRRMLNSLWVDTLSRDEQKLAAQATHDPAAMLSYRRLSQRLTELKKSLLQGGEKL